MKKHIALLLALVMMLAVFAGCAAKQETEAPADPTPAAETPVEETPAADAETPDAEAPASAETLGDGKYVVGICLNNITNPFRIFDFNYGVTWFDEPEHSNWTYVQTAAANDITRQIGDMEDLIAQGVDCIVIGCLNEEAMTPALLMAKEAGIPVVASDRNITNPDLRLGYVGKDNYTDFYNYGLKVREKLGDEGKVVMLLGADGNAVTEEAYAGYCDALEGSKIEVVNLSYSNWNRAESITVFESVYLANQDIVAVLTESDEAALGVIQVLQAEGRDDIMVFGHDGCKEALEAIKAGTMTATMQNPRNMLYDSIDMAAKYVSTGELESEFIVCPTTYIDAVNVDEFYDPDSPF